MNNIKNQEALRKKLRKLFEYDLKSENNKKESNKNGSTSSSNVDSIDLAFSNSKLKYKITNTHNDKEKLSGAKTNEKKDQKSMKTKNSKNSYELNSGKGLNYRVLNNNIDDSQKLKRKKLILKEDKRLPNKISSPPKSPQCKFGPRPLGYIQNIADGLNKRKRKNDVFENILHESKKKKTSETNHKGISTKNSEGNATKFNKNIKKDKNAEVSLKSAKKSKLNSHQQNKKKSGENKTKQIFRKIKLTPIAQNSPIKVKKPFTNSNINNSISLKGNNFGCKTNKKKKLTTEKLTDGERVKKNTRNKSELAGTNFSKTDSEEGKRENDTAHCMFTSREVRAPNCSSTKHLNGMLRSPTYFSSSDSDSHFSVDSSHFIKNLNGMFCSGMSSSSDSDFTVSSSETTNSSYESDYSDYEEDSFLSSNSFLSNSADDKDYKLPKYVEEDLYIPFGAAKIYNIDENMDVNFGSDQEHQIIELPNNSKNISIENDAKEEPTLNKISQQDREGSVNSCPELVPITYDIYNAKNDTCEVFDDSFSEISSEKYSDCNSWSSERTEGSLCLLENENVLVIEASQMKPEIFNVESKEIKNLNNLNEQLIENNSLDMQNFETQHQIKNDNLNEITMSFVDKILENPESLELSTSNYNYITTPKGNISTNQLSNVSVSQNVVETRFYNGFDSRHVLVLLKNKIHIYGTIKLQLIAGCIDIFGYTPLTNEILELYSPRGYSFLNITPCKYEPNFELAENLMNYKDIFLASEINDVIDNFKAGEDSILILEKNYLTKKIDLLSKYMKENLFPSMSPVQIDRPYYASEFLLRSIIYNETENELIVDPKWKTPEIMNTTKLMIIGGKSVGKSTCLRYIINSEIKKYKKFLLIDLDIGQSEIFLPQTISATIIERPLLGPGYFLNLNPDIAFLYGDINVVLDPERYLRNIKELSQYCHNNKDFDNMPWVINTMGYNKGFGSELIAIICHYFRPTEILQLQSSKESQNFNFFMEKETVKNIPLNVFKNENLLLETSTMRLEFLENIDFKLTVIDSISNKIDRNKSKKKIWEMYSKDTRYAMLIIRLGAVLGDKYDWLTDVKPIVCSTEDIKFKIYHNEYLSDEEFLDVANANLVYMCYCENKDTSLKCYGIGIVRGIDKTCKKIYLISSVVTNLLKNVNCLAICNMPLPSSILLNQGPKIRGNVPYTYNTNEYIASRAIKHFDRSYEKTNT